MTARAVARGGYDCYVPMRHKNPVPARRQCGHSRGPIEAPTSGESGNLWNLATTLAAFSRSLCEGVLQRCWPLEDVCIESQPLRLQDFPQCLLRQPVEHGEGPCRVIVGIRTVDCGHPAVCLRPPTDGSQAEMDRARLMTLK
ncbi:uncharacterized protein LOC119456242 [Dermacentor silvarum]|uniref:uncharacterized protein LOC119456242 n=1 Tax=Dermacentor silvarum TaxID=543639 RepID=UPI001897751B|nr:uncharacterized protein LOC119456242 [Dermacentor silvarum]